MAEPLHRVGAQIRVDPGKVGVDVVRDRDRSAESPCSPGDLGGALDQGGDMSTLSGRGPTATRPWLAISAAARPSRAFTALLPTSGVADAA